MATKHPLEHLDRLVGTWTTEATHPAFPGAVVKGTVEIAWLEGKRFLIHRARTDHPDFPDSISIIGAMGHDRVDHDRRTVDRDDAPQLSMHYFDSRGVFREYDVSIDERTWRIWRDAPGFSQRFAGDVVEGGNLIVGRWELQEEDERWRSDLEITYRRRG
jgi:hypothetical protein